jgi:hypothetical protein
MTSDCNKNKLRKGDWVKFSQGCIGQIINIKPYIDDELWKSADGIEILYKNRRIIEYGKYVQKVSDEEAMLWMLEQ